MTESSHSPQIIPQSPIMARDEASVEIPVVHLAANAAQVASAPDNPVDEQGIKTPMKQSSAALVSHSEDPFLPCITSSPNHTLPGDISAIAGPSGVCSRFISPNETASSTASKHYENWEKSPFKSYLKIGSDVIMTRKVPKTKPPIPPAVSGDEYCKYLVKKQNAKVAEEEGKKQRKEEREKKKELKSKKTGAAKKLFSKANNNHDCDNDNSDDSADIQMVLDDSDDYVNLTIPSDECCACLGDNEKENPDAWIGCSYCERWYHRVCLGEDYENSTNTEVKDIDLKCNECVKAEQRKKNKKRC